MAGPVGKATWIQSDANPNVAAVHGAYTDEGLANARLIAAAPKMLEALKGILPFVAEDFPPGNDFPVTHGYARAYRAILDAIAIAEPLP